MQDPKMQSQEADTRRARDWTAQFPGRLIWWIIPALVIVIASLFRLSIAHMAFICAGAFAWAGAGCVRNAWRCGRLHCFFSGPALWLGALGAVLTGIRVLSGAHDLNYVVDGTAAFVLLSFIPEVLWGKYVRPAQRDSAAGQ